LAVKNLDGDNRADLLAGSGPGGSRVTAYRGANLATAAFELDAFADSTLGVFVG
jgi:hypothetical protein